MDLDINDGMTKKVFFSRGATVAGMGLFLSRSIARYFFFFCSKARPFRSKPKSVLPLRRRFRKDWKIVSSVPFDFFLFLPT